MMDDDVDDDVDDYVDDDVDSIDADSFEQTN